MGGKKKIPNQGRKAELIFGLKLIFLPLFYVTVVTFFFSPTDLNSHPTFAQVI